MEKKLDSGYYFIREKDSDKIITAHYDGVVFDTGLKKKLQEFEVVGLVPPDVVCQCVKGTKILNLAKAMQLKRERN